MADYSSFKAEDFLLDDRFIDYCKNRNDKDFREMLEKNHPEIDGEVVKAIEMYDLISLKATSRQKEVELNNLKTVLSSIDKSNESNPARSKTRFHRINYFVAAALLLGIIAAGSIWYNSTFKTQNKVQEYSLKQFNTILTSPVDDRREVTLPDGSTIVLNYGSTIKVEDGFNEKNRRVFLQGEAYFIVETNIKKPFTVITNHSQTTALGTSFKIKDVPGENSANIMLATGKVNVLAGTQKEQQAFILTPGNQLTINQSGKAIPATFSQQQLTGWKNIQINFESADLATIIRQVEYYYGVKIVLQNEPQSPIALTGKFYDKSLKDVLEAISFTNKLTYRQKENTVFIEFKNQLN